MHVPTTGACPTSILNGPSATPPASAAAPTGLQRETPRVQASAGSKQTRLPPVLQHPQRQIDLQTRTSFGCDGPQPGWGDFNSRPFSSVRTSVRSGLPPSYDAAAKAKPGTSISTAPQESNLGRPLLPGPSPTVTFAAVPRETPWAMMLAGLDLIGVLAQPLSGLNRPVGELGSGKSTFPQVRGPLMVAIG